MRYGLYETRAIAAALLLRPSDPSCQRRSLRALRQNLEIWNRELLPKAGVGSGGTEGGHAASSPVHASPPPQPALPALSTECSWLVLFAERLQAVEHLSERLGQEEDVSRDRLDELLTLLRPDCYVFCRTSCSEHSCSEHSCSEHRLPARTGKINIQKRKAKLMFLHAYATAERCSSMHMRRAKKKNLTLSSNPCQKEHP